MNVSGIQRGSTAEETQRILEGIFGKLEVAQGAFGEVKDKRDEKNYNERHPSDSTIFDNVYPVGLQWRRRR